MDGNADQVELEGRLLIYEWIIMFLMRRISNNEFFQLREALLDEEIYPDGSSPAKLIVSSEMRLVAKRLLDGAEVMRQPSS